MNTWRHRNPIIQKGQQGYSVLRIAELCHCSTAKVIRVLDHYWETR